MLIKQQKITVFNFVYEDMNDNQKLRLHNNITNKYVYEFKCKEELQ